MSAPIIWINGPFGVGKSHTAAYLQEHLAKSFLFDPEDLGFTLRRLTPDFSDDFQLHPLWVPFVLNALCYAAKNSTAPIIVPMTVTDLSRHTALLQGLRDSGLTVHHVTLLAPSTVVHARLRLRLERRNSWAGQQVEARLTDLQHPAFALHLNTENLSISQVAEAIAKHAEVTLKPRQRNPLRWLKSTRRFMR